MKKTWSTREWTLFVAVVLFTMALARPVVNGFVDGLVAGFTDDR